MAESTFTFRVDDELRAAFAEVAATPERSTAQLLRVLMKDAVNRDRELREQDRWFRGEITHSLSEADDPDTPRLAHATVRSSWQQQRAAFGGAGDRTYRVKIEWLPAAARNLVARLDRIGERDTWAAIDVGDAAHEAVARLADDPAVGRPGRVAGTRELVMVGTPYVVVYRIERTVVLVLRILHGVTDTCPTRHRCGCSGGPTGPAAGSNVSPLPGGPRSRSFSLERASSISPSTTPGRGHPRRHPGRSSSCAATVMALPCTPSPGGSPTMAPRPRRRTLAVPDHA